MRIDASNQVFWNNSPTPVDVLQQKMEEVVQADPTNQPELRIDANPDAEYEVMAKVLAAAKNSQMKKNRLHAAVNVSARPQHNSHDATATPPETVAFFFSVVWVVVGSCKHGYGAAISITLLLAAEQPVH